MHANDSSAPLKYQPYRSILGIAAAAALGASAVTQMTWRQPQALGPGLRTDHAMAYDVARSRVVMFGGFDGTRRTNDTWERRGTTWIRRGSTHSPSERTGHAMAYDLARQRVVLFGGWGQSALGDTWEWDGSDWILRAPSSSPSARSGHVMAYDVSRQRVVLFGGRGQPAHGDTWEWDGSTWISRNSTRSPIPGRSHAMAYDLARKRIVLFGAGTRNDETWEWDGTDWSQSLSVATPPGRTGHAMAYDVTRQRVILFGGENGVGTPLDDTWHWDGNSWSKGLSAPTDRVNHAMVYDVDRQRVVVFGGSHYSGLGPYFWRRTLEWDGRKWTVTAPSTTPWRHWGRTDSAMVYDRARGRTLLFGGSEQCFGDCSLGDTWDWDGQRWTHRASVGPPPRHHHAMAYDVVRRCAVLFGGLQGTRTTTTPLSDTWEWDGQRWIQRMPSNGPGDLQQHAMVYDPSRQRVVLFGGMAGNNLSDATWEWDGSDWIARAPSQRPSARKDHALAYDIVGRRVLLFGGTDGSRLFSDTWAWDGTNWRRVQTTNASPSPRRGHAMVTDSFRRRIVLLGGLDFRGYGLDGTWEWDGQVWFRASPRHSPAPQNRHVMAYDSTLQRVVMFGSSMNTWFYASPAETTKIGTACSPRNGTPILTSSQPYLGHSTFFLETLQARTNSPCVFGISNSIATTRVGPCSFYLDGPMVTMLTVTNWAGIAESPTLTIPLDPALRGTSAFAQAFVIDPSASSIGLAFTSGLKLLLGD